jgi:hypothetical protein
MPLRFWNSPHVGGTRRAARGCTPGPTQTGVCSVGVTPAWVSEMAGLEVTPGVAVGVRVGVAVGVAVGVGWGWLLVCALALGVLVGVAVGVRVACMSRPACRRCRSASGVAVGSQCRGTGRRRGARRRRSRGRSCPVTPKTHKWTGRRVGAALSRSPQRMVGAVSPQAVAVVDVGPRRCRDPSSSSKVTIAVPTGTRLNRH